MGLIELPDRRMARFGGGDREPQKISRAKVDPNGLRGDDGGSVHGQVRGGTGGDSSFIAYENTVAPSIRGSRGTQG